MLGRISYALRALLHGVPEPDVREVEIVREVGGAEDVTLYKVNCQSYSISRMFRDDAQAAFGSYHLTCEAAFTATGGKDYFYVETADAVQIGSRYFLKCEVSVQPKPKRAKGKP